MKRIIIAGGRDFKDYELLERRVQEVLTPYTIANIRSDMVDITYNCLIVSGMAKGADALGERFAAEHKVYVDQYPAHWGEIEDKPSNEIRTGANGEKYWVKAGHFRNQQMADNADVLIVFWDGKSTGTKDMIARAMRNRLTIHLYYY